MDKNSPEYVHIARNLPMYPPVPAAVPFPFYSFEQMQEFAVEAILKDRESRATDSAAARAGAGTETPPRHSLPGAGPAGMGS